MAQAEWTIMAQTNLNLWEATDRWRTVQLINIPCLICRATLELLLNSLSFNLGRWWRCNQTNSNESNRLFEIVFIPVKINVCDTRTPSKFSRHLKRSTQTYIDHLRSGPELNDWQRGSWRTTEPEQDANANDIEDILGMDQNIWNPREQKISRRLMSWW